MNQEYMYRRLDKLEEQVAVVMRKYREYDELEQNRRIDEEKDVERVKTWIQEKDRKEAKFRSKLEGLKKQLDADEDLKKRQQNDINELNDEVQYLGGKMRAESQLAKEILEKLEKLTKSVEDLQNGRGTLMGINKNESVFDREMRSVTDLIVQNGEKEKETHKNLFDDIRDGMEKIKTYLESQKKQIESHKVSQDCFAKSTNASVQAIRKDIDQFIDFTNQTVERVGYLRTNIDEIDYYAREMYAEQMEQKMLIDRLCVENSNLCSDYSNLQEKMSIEIQALRDEIEELKKKDDDQSERAESAESVSEDNTDSIHSSSGRMDSVPIREAIIGDWKLIACQHMDKLCSENTSLNFVTRTSEKIRISITKNKLTTYFLENGNYKREEKFNFGHPAGCSNHWFVDQQSIKSKSYLVPSKVDSLETCTRYINKKQRLVIINEINGCSAIRVYEKCVE